jgi:hypothetical protein
MPLSLLLLFASELCDKVNLIFVAHRKEMVIKGSGMNLQYFQ